MRFGPVLPRDSCKSDGTLSVLGHPLRKTPLAGPGTRQNGIQAGRMELDALLHGRWQVHGRGGTARHSGCDRLSSRDGSPAPGLTLAGRRACWQPPLPAGRRIAIGFCLRMSHASASHAAKEPRSRSRAQLCCMSVHLHTLDECAKQVSVSQHVVHREMQCLECAQ